MPFVGRSSRMFGLAAGILGAGLMVTAPAHAVAGGSPVTDGSSPFTVKVDTEGRSCTGALVAPQWVVTAGSCFGDSQAGPPAEPSTATIGRPDLSSGTGQVVAVTELVPQESRDLVLAKLAYPVTTVGAIGIGAGATEGETLRLTGYGRTSTEWVPDQVQAADFTVSSVADTTVGINAEASACKGDAGAPVVRNGAAGPELVAVGVASWQHGCLGETETRDGATAARVDDLAGWIDEQSTGLTIRNHNGQCLDLGSNDPGTPVVIATCVPDNPSQQWSVPGDGTVRNHNGLCVELTESPAKIAQCAPENPAQQWRRPGDGTFVHETGSCMDIGSNAPGTKVGVHTCRAGATSQQWKVPAVGSIVNHNGLCADLRYNDPGTIVMTTDCRPTHVSQRWGVMEDGTIRNHNGLCLDLRYNDPGSKGLMAACRIGAASQQWRLPGDGTIRNHNGQCLDLGSNDPGTPLVIARCVANNPSQQWEHRS